MVIIQKNYLSNVIINTLKFSCLKYMYVSGLIVEARSINLMWQVALIHNTAFVWVLPIPLMAQFLALVIIRIQYKRTWNAWNKYSNAVPFPKPPTYQKMTSIWFRTHERAVGKSAHKVQQSLVFEIPLVLQSHHHHQEILSRHLFGQQSIGGLFQYILEQTRRQQPRFYPTLQTIGIPRQKESHLQAWMIQDKDLMTWRPK